ncbi:unnamed protein product, partial [Sphenostylis stenocarpa]
QPIAFTLGSTHARSHDVIPSAVHSPSTLETAESWKQRHSSIVAPLPMEKKTKVRTFGRAVLRVRVDHVLHCNEEMSQGSMR